jgi:cysteine desulfurase
MSLVYADNNATTQVAPEVHAAMVPFFTGDYFNPSSMYEPARLTASALAQSRAIVARFFGQVDPREILFTSCATESNNAAIVGTAQANPKRRHIVTTAVEHPAVFEVCKEIQRSGYEVTFLPVDRSGNLDVREFIRALRPDTLLVSVMHANNETGVVFPIEQLSRLVHEADPEIVFHTDATQTVGKIAIRLDDQFRHVHLLSMSGHKVHAPKGIGVLYVRRGTAWRPWMIGGHQEEGRRAGTENVPYIAGLAKALELAADDPGEEARIERLRDRLEQGIVERIPWVEINGQGATRLPNTLNVACHFIEGEGILYQLSSHGICASSGSACTSGSLEPSHVLRAMNVPFTAVQGSVRFSFSRYNSDADVDRILEVFPQIVANLRRLPPYWDAQNNQPRPEAEKMLSAKTLETAEQS